MTGGGPGRATNVLVYYIYNTAFVKFKFGYASAISMVLFVLVLGITLVQFRGDEKMGAVRKDGRYFVKRILLYMLILALAAVMLVPFLWMISASLKLNKDVFTYPVKWIPEKLEWSNYSKIWKEIPLLLFFKNSAKLTIIITAIQVFTSSFAAYAFAKLHF